MVARSVEKTAGILFLAFLVAIVLALMFSWSGQPATTATDTGVYEDRGPQETTQDILDNKGRLMMATAFFLVAGVVSGVLAATLYLAFRPSSQLLALLGATGFLIAAVFLLGNGMVYVSLWSVAVAFERSTGPTADAFAVSAYSHVELVRNSWAVVLLASLPLSVGASGFVMLRNGNMPSILGWLAMASSVLLLLGWLAFMGGPFILPGGIGLVVVLFWLLLAGGWLMARGTPSAA